MEQHDIVVDADGTIRFVYADELAALFEGEAQHTTRASHVEPHVGGSGWLADMRPSGGPILGANGSHYDPIDMAIGCKVPYPIEVLGDVQTHMIKVRVTPFATRQAALDAERAWLREHKGL